jgi:hypothetical protein
VPGAAPPVRDGGSRVVRDGAPRLVRDAAEFARDRHHGQCRKGTDLPYLIHPAGVASILACHYPGRDELEAAGWLHDTLEDTPTTRHDLETRFGPEVRRLVEAVTNGWRQLLRPRRDPDACRLKAADTLDNVTFTIEGLRRGEDVWPRFRAGRGKIGEWRRIAAATDRHIGGEPLAAELWAAMRELEAIAADDGRRG